MNKKGQLFDMMSFIKGLFVGFILGAVIVFLGARGILPIPGLG